MALEDWAVAAARGVGGAELWTGKALSWAARVGGRHRQGLGEPQSGWLRGAVSRESVHPGRPQGHDGATRR